VKFVASRAHALSAGSAELPVEVSSLDSSVAAEASTRFDAMRCKSCLRGTRLALIEVNMPVKPDIVVEQVVVLGMVLRSWNEYLFLPVECFAAFLECRERT